MQNSNPSQNPASVPFPFSLDPTLAAAYGRARDAGAVPSARGIFTLADLLRGLGASGEHASASPTTPHEVDSAGAAEGAEPAGSSTDDGPDIAAPAFDLDRVLRALRVPIDWCLSVAELRTDDTLDATSVEDVSAIRRVRYAFEHRIADRTPDAAGSEDAPYVRASDLVVVLERLFGTIDLALVGRAVRALSTGLAEALAQVIQLYPAITSLFTHTATPPMDPLDADTLYTHGASCPSSRVHPSVSPTAPFSTAYYVPIPYRPRAYGPSSVDLYASLLHPFFHR